MSIDVAKKAVIDAFSALTENEELEIDFHGGEPFLAFNLIRDLCEWIWSRTWKKPYICFSTTNGTLIKGEIKEWVTRNSGRFWLGLSLDGTKEMHDINRSNSYDQIDIDFFLSKWPAQSVKMTISDKTLPFLAEGVMHLHHKGFKFHANLAYGTNWSDKKNLIEYARQLQILTNFYLQNPGFEPSGPFAVKIEGMNYKKTKSHKWCGVGTDMTAIDVDGNAYPCQMFLPNTSGKISNGKQINWESPKITSDEKCFNCSFSLICPTCYGKNLIERGNTSIRDEGLCIMFKMQVLACSNLKANLLLKEIKIPDSAEDGTKILLQIEAIKKIQEKLKDDLIEEEIFN